MVTSGNNKPGFYFRRSDMRQGDFEKFLRDTLPEMGYVWRRLSRKNVRRKLRHRMENLRIQELADYRDLLLKNPEEMAVFESLLRVTITRFYRNAAVWEELGQILIREVGALDTSVIFSSWSVGCAGGEEPYTLAMLLNQLSETGEFHHPWRILGSDSDEASLKRAGERIYKWGSVREVPQNLLERWFDHMDDLWVLSPDITDNVTMRSHETLHEPPPGTFHLVLVRNSIFTYNTPEVGKRLAETIRGCLAPPGLLVVGRKESLPEGSRFEQIAKCIYKKC